MDSVGCNALCDVILMDRLSQCRLQNLVYMDGFGNRDEYQNMIRVLCGRQNISADIVQMCIKYRELLADAVLVYTVRYDGLKNRVLLLGLL